MTITLNTPVTNGKFAVSYNYQKCQVVSSYPVFHFQNRLTSTNFSYIDLNNDSNKAPKSIKGIADRGYFIDQLHSPYAGTGVNIPSSVIGELAIVHKTNSDKIFILCIPIVKGSATDLNTIKDTGTGSQTTLNLNGLLESSQPTNGDPKKLYAYDYDDGKNSITMFYINSPITFNGDLGGKTSFEKILGEYSITLSSPAVSHLNEITSASTTYQKPISIQMSPDGTSQETDTQKAQNWSYLNQLSFEKIASIVGAIVLLILVPLGIRGLFGIRGMYIIILLAVVCAILTISLYSSASSTSIAKKGSSKTKVDKIKKIKIAGFFIGLLMIILCIDLIITDKDNGNSIGFYGKLMLMSKKSNASNASAGAGADDDNNE